MGAKYSSSIFSIGDDIISTAVEGKNGAITYRLGHLGSPDNPDGDPDVAIDAIHWGTLGVAARPAEAEPDGDAAPGRSAQTLSINMSGENHVIAVRDLRTNRIFGQLKPGETALYGASEGRVLIKQNGSINLYTTKNNEVGGAGMGIFIDPDSDQISIVNSKGYGFIVNGDGAFMIGPGGAFKVEEAGVSMISSGGKAQVDGTSIVLGSTAVPGVNSALVGVTGIVGVASTKVLIALS